MTEDDRIGFWEVLIIVLTFPVSVPVILLMKGWYRFRRWYIPA